MKKIIIGIVVITILIVVGYFLLGNSKSNDTSQLPLNNQQNTENSVAANNVGIASFKFSPSSITIKVGESVSWTNQDSASHTIVSDSGSEIQSSSLVQGASYSHTFNAAGTYNYHCGIHPSMKGVVVVQ